MSVSFCSSCNAKQNQVRLFQVNSLFIVQGLVGILAIEGLGTEGNMYHWSKSYSIDSLRQVELHQRPCMLLM